MKWAVVYFMATQADHLTEIRVNGDGIVCALVPFGVFYLSSLHSEHWKIASKAPHESKVLSRRRHSCDWEHICFARLDAALIVTLIDTCRDEKGAAISYRATGAITEGRHAFFSDDAPVVSRFSSRGPSVMDDQKNPADVLKPDILAPGAQIWVAWSSLGVSDPVLSGNDFALLSGTSMAAPHVAGVAALIKQLRPSWNPSMVASALSTTALKHDRRGLPLQSQGSDLYSKRTLRFRGCFPGESSRMRTVKERKGGGAREGKRGAEREASVAKDTGLSWA
ncbi:hypothetical protein ZIOFF_042760 [Zingiber officinale]|uniref:Peptidase S8/S53 domain-containing protein n=1 Tax=Zingiber officinale TaxID=94328 RepID=A0A8J5FTS6_ZINOF|nr:hypothetical protein ZIOFF_042760 [Zingiber officinale]